MSHATRPPRAGFVRVALAVANVPEPASLAVLGLGGLALLRRRRGTV